MLSNSPEAKQGLHTPSEALAVYFNAFTQNLVNKGVAPNLINRAIKKAMPELTWVKQEDAPEVTQEAASTRQSGYGYSFVKYVASTGLKVLPNVASKKITDKSITKLAAGFVGGGVVVQWATEIAVDSVLDIGSYLFSYRAKQDNKILVKCFDAQICAYFVQMPDLPTEDEPLAQLDTKQSITIDIDSDKLKQALYDCLDNLLNEGVPEERIITCASAAKLKLNHPLLKPILENIIDSKANEWVNISPKKRKRDQASSSYYGAIVKTSVTTSLKFASKKVRKKLKEDGIIDIAVSFVPLGAPAKFVTELAIEVVGDFSQSFVTTYSSQEKRNLTQMVGSSILVNYNHYRSNPKNDQAESMPVEVENEHHLSKNDQTQPPSQNPIVTPKR